MAIEFFRFVVCLFFSVIVIVIVIERWGKGLESISESGRCRVRV